MSISLQRLMRYLEETSMFKYGGDNIGKRNTHPAKLRDVARVVKRRALLGRSGACPSSRNFLIKLCNLVRFGVYLDQILSLKFF